MSFSVSRILSWRYSASGLCVVSASEFWFITSRKWAGEHHIGDSQGSASWEVWIVEIQTACTIQVTACKGMFPALSSMEQSFAVRFSWMVCAL